MRVQFLFYGLIFLCAKACAQTPVQVDGPYVRYNGKQLIAQTIWRNHDSLSARTEKGILQVVPEGRLDWGFQILLQSKLNRENPRQPAAGQMLFLSDIEGEFAKFRQILLTAKVIDEQYRWIYKHGRLVIAGDLFDRGKDVVPELWLLYKLEYEARKAGGSVHIILGNHDIMNLAGDHRYTDAKYKIHAQLMKTDLDSLFASNTEMGRWLRSKNIIEKIGDVLVMHGGLSPKLVQEQLTLQQINQRYLPYDFQKKGDPEAPFWYRGYFLAPKASMALVDSTLKQYHCKWILVGHTIVKWNIASYYEGKVIGVDVDYHKGKPMAALLENGNWFFIDDQGNRKFLLYQKSNDNIKKTDIL